MELFLLGFVDQHLLPRLNPSQSFVWWKSKNTTRRAWQRFNGSVLCK